MRLQTKFIVATIAAAATVFAGTAIAQKERKAPKADKEMQKVLDALASLGKH